LLIQSYLGILLMKSTIQPSIDHLILESCLHDEKEMLTLAHQFPNFKYLELFLPTDKASFIKCLNILSNQDHKIKKENCLWPKLIYVLIRLFGTHKMIISEDKQIRDRFLQYINPKDHNDISFVQSPLSPLTIWY